MEEEQVRIAGLFFIVPHDSMFQRRRSVASHAGMTCQSREMAMKTFVGMGFVATIAMLFVVTSADRASAAAGSEVMTTSVKLTDVSAARRVRHAHRRHHYRHHRARVYVRSPYRPYYERPSYYVPQGPAPFFPFGFGYGLDPSW
jgi:hypothetical protein